MKTYSGPQSDQVLVTLWAFYSQRMLRKSVIADKCKIPISSALFSALPVSHAHHVQLSSSNQVCCDALVLPFHLSVILKMIPSGLLVLLYTPALQPGLVHLSLCPKSPEVIFPHGQLSLPIGYGMLH